MERKFILLIGGEVWPERFWSKNLDADFGTPDSLSIGWAHEFIFLPDEGAWLHAGFGAKKDRRGPDHELGAGSES